MWDAVRKIFRQDDAPEVTEQPDTLPGPGAPVADTSLGNDGSMPAAMTPATVREDAPAHPQPVPATSSRDPEGGPATPATPVAPGTTMRISPSSHAPQGLAAEGPVSVELGTPRDPSPPSPSSPPSLSSPSSPSSPREIAGGVAEVTREMETPGQLMEGDAMTSPRTAQQWTASREREELTPSSDHVDAASGGDVMTTPPAESSIPDASPPATAVVIPASTPEDNTEQGVGDGATAAASAGVSSPSVPPALDATPGTVTELTDSVGETPGRAQQPRLDDTRTLAQDTPVSPSVIDTAADTPSEATDSATAVVEPEQEAPGVEAKEDILLAPGTVVADRYTIVETVDQSAATRAYRAVDARSYERCWSCGSAQNGPGTRFCQNCGAPIQNHQVVLAQTVAPAGLPDEVASNGVYLHVQPERRRFGVEGVGIEVGAHSAEGPHHPNEDSYWYTTRTLCANSVRRSRAVAVLADGMGGYAPGSGLISSRIAATVGGAVIAALDAHGDATEPSSDEIEGMVRAGIAGANNMVIEEIARSGEMGATLVVAVVCGDMAYVANIGDSRAYYVDPQGQAARITRDQSLVAQELAQAGLSEDDIYNAPGNNIILHAVGEQNVETAADWYAQPLEPDSLLVLCSDGYWKTMRGTLISADVLRQDRAGSADDTLNDVAHRMVDDALGRGSDDNTTVLLVSIS